MTAPLVLVNARLIDGTGAPPRDVRVLRDKSRIAAIVQDGRLVKDALNGAAHAL